KYVYKIKKPIKYSFLDFSTLALRKHFCEREIKLNRRITQGVYLGIEPIRQVGESLQLGGEEGVIIDYAIKMHKLKESRRMDILLAKKKVSLQAIEALAERIASFHQNAKIIYEKDLSDIREKFNDLETEKANLVQWAGPEY